MIKKYKIYEMDADEARELLYDIRDGKIKYEEVDWGDETIKEAIKDTFNPKNSNLNSAETFSLFKSVVLISKHTKEYIIFYSCAGYKIVHNYSYTYNKDELGQYDIEIFFPNGRYESFPLIDYDLFIHEDLSSRLFDYPN